MQQNRYMPDTANAITRYFNKADQFEQQATLGQIVVEILTDGRSLNRKAICTKLLGRLENAADAKEENHYQTLIGLLFEN
ncbi:regulatory protein YcgZ [Erwinia sp. SLM-02]|uniref:regulatory protein YcgZ n=1 Tax=Erwinia sp. SLM-02 TaxID=3020057 RepID=UPI0028D31D19|nr:regulatory protein YcgZ [uncultured Erwinia sp.]